MKKADSILNANPGDEVEVDGEVWTVTGHERENNKFLPGIATERVVLFRFIHHHVEPIEPERHGWTFLSDEDRLRSTTIGDEAILKHTSQLYRSLTEKRRANRRR